MIPFESNNIASSLSVQNNHFCNNSTYLRPEQHCRSASCAPINLANTSGRYQIHQSISCSVVPVSSSCCHYINSTSRNNYIPTQHNLLTTDTVQPPSTTLRATSRNDESTILTSAQFNFQPKPEPLDDYYQMPFGQPHPIFSEIGNFKNVN